jgi:hypothetical protein
MICPGCEKDVNPKDFLLDHPQCYKCIYKQKIEQSKNGKLKKCRVCSKPIYNKYKLVYCSDECSSEGAKRSKHESWARNYQGSPSTLS